MKLNQLQACFFETTRSPEKRPPEMFANAITQNNFGERLAIYRNNYHASLHELLGEIYPSIVSVLGEEAFQILAQKYWAEHPPEDARMYAAGQTFSNFLEGEKPLENLPYLSDVAKLDYLFNAAYYQEYRPAIEAQEIAALAPETFAQSQLKLQASLYLINSEFSIYSIWQLCSGEENNEIAMDVPQSVLIFQNSEGVSVYLIEAAAAEFYRLLDEHTVASAISHTLESHIDFKPNRSNCIFNRTRINC